MADINIFNVTNKPIPLRTNGPRTTKSGVVCSRRLLRLFRGHVSIKFAETSARCSRPGFCAVSSVANAPAPYVWQSSCPFLLSMTMRDIRLHLVQLQERFRSLFRQVQLVRTTSGRASRLIKSLASTISAQISRDQVWALSSQEESIQLIKGRNLR